MDIGKKRRMIIGKDNKPWVSSLLLPVGDNTNWREGSSSYQLAATLTGGKAVEITT